MEDLICNAYAYLEFKTFDRYRSVDVGDRNNDQILKDWLLILNNYNTVSKFMSDKAIEQAQKLVLNVF